MKKIVLSSLFIVAVAGYVFYQNMTGQTNTVAITNNKNQAPAQTQTNTTSGEPVKNPTTQPVANNTPASTGKYKNGTYTGPVENAYFGNVQVEAVIQNSALADITFLQYPNHGHSLQVSEQSMPTLKSEAIAAQSANVDVVSGATQMSDAFQQSLSSALAMAAN